MMMINCVRPIRVKISEGGAFPKSNFPQISTFLSLQKAEKFLKINERGDIFKERSV